MFKNLWEKVKFFSSEAFDFLKPFIKVLLSNAGKILAAAAVDAVKVVASTYGDSDGETKRKEAFNLIEDHLKQEGINLGTSMINLAIEAAVSKLKEESTN